MSEPTMLLEQFLNQAYNHPKFAAVLFDYPTVCPNCKCEFVFILKKEVHRRIFRCLFCGIINKESEMLAA